MTDNSKPIEIIVNKQPVVVQGHDQTGASIKEAAIHAHLPIQLTFQLALVKNKKRQLIGDNEPVHVEKGETFACTDTDDNS